MWRSFIVTLLLIISPRYCVGETRLGQILTDAERQWEETIRYCQELKANATGERNSIITQAREEAKIEKAEIMGATATLRAQAEALLREAHHKAAEIIQVAEAEAQAVRETAAQRGEREAIRLIKEAKTEAEQIIVNARSLQGRAAIIGELGELRPILDMHAYITLALVPGSLILACLWLWCWYNRREFEQRLQMEIAGRKDK
jgi:F0F1-type ATP synthase membrane subunit b/b'